MCHSGGYDISFLLCHQGGEHDKEIDLGQHFSSIMHICTHNSFPLSTSLNRFLSLFTQSLRNPIPMLRITHYANNACRSIYVCRNCVVSVRNYGPDKVTVCHSGRSSISISECITTARWTWTFLIHRLRKFYYYTRIKMNNDPRLVRK